MLNPLPRPTYRRWTMFYGTVTSLLVGWLLFEKIPNGREELAGSVENTFRGSGEAMIRYNREILDGIGDLAADYPSPYNEEYKNRAGKAVLLAEMSENWSKEDGTNKRLSVLKDSLVTWADSDETYQKEVEDILKINLTNDHFENHKAVIASFLQMRAQELAILMLNYCAQKVSGDCGFDMWMPVFQSSVVTPTVSEPVQAEIFLSTFKAHIGCVNTTAFFNNQILPFRDRVAHLSTTFPTSGPHTLTVRFRLERCRDGSVTEVSRDFQVNVLERCGSKD